MKQKTGFCVYNYVQKYEYILIVQIFFRINLYKLL